MVCMTTSSGVNKTLHVSIENRKRLSAFGAHGDTWNDIIGKVLDIAEQSRAADKMKNTIFGEDVGFA